MKVKSTGTRCKVILRGLREETETPQSFTIKFSLLTRVPVTKIKNVVRSLPSVVWEGYEINRADKLLSMIEECGGVGEVVHVDEDGQSDSSEGESPASGDKDKKACPRCGYPVENGQDYCEFCYSPLHPYESGDAAGEPRDREEEKSYSIPRGRMIVYLGIIIVLILTAIFTNI